ncbi:endonuclease G [Isoptericola sp. CG 20/1183]|uniref:Endonuclease G n=1 Tax=Isoptericola halotolerans TaxID=300560 RepID=A0ABX5EGC4_9MICO|nr:MULTISPECIES: DNA/RNA non-specific endonuclease [Isoptericola]PRZ08545.1 endonuclease G [Isoptericola halotolerans]PRZ11008.1 endonuclease G [Isoptericola sp. CG 20/1183]
MTGYDAQFLGPDEAVRVPLPTAGRPLRQLDHPRFSVLLDPQRRLAAATACTVDGARLRPLPRSGSWRLDPQAPPHEQAGNELYRHNPLDRGHLVRRLDPMWGTIEEAREAGEATFVYTNAAPQVAELNQSKELWNGLEDHVLEYADAHDHRVVVQTGCVFLGADPVYRGVAIPRQFWKVVAWAAAGDGPGTGSPAPTLQSAAFVLDQTPLLTDAELSTATGRALAVGHVPPLGPFRTFQVPVADVERLTGLGLGPLVAADVRGPAPDRPLEPRTVSHRPPSGWTELTGPADVVPSPPR